MRVRAGCEYVFDPVPLDLCDPKVRLIKGDVVKVINLPGAPKANTMNHCHVEKDGVFMGMVCCNSLEPKK